MFSATDTHFQIMAFSPILLNRKLKRCIFGQKSKFEKKNFLSLTMAWYTWPPMLAKSQNSALLTCSNYIQIWSIWYFFRITQVFTCIRIRQIFISMLRGQYETCLLPKASLVFAPEHRNENPTPLYFKKNLSYSEKIPY